MKTRLQLASAISAMLVLTACGGSSSSSTIGGGKTENSPPDIGNVYFMPYEWMTEAVAGFELTLYGTAADPDGDTVSYEWEVIDAPVGEDEGLVFSGHEVSFVPRAHGEYVIRLTVSDGEDSASKTGSVEVTANKLPVVELDKPPPGLTDRPVFFQVAHASDPEGESMSFQWRIAAGPDGHNASIETVDDDSAKAIFDLPGTYQVDIVASDGFNELTKTVTANVVAKLAELDGFVIDAEHSEALDAVLIVTSTPRRLYKFSLSDETLEYVDLYKSGLSVSVSPDGLQAAIGYDAAIQILDLQSMNVLKTLTVSTSAQDVVFGSGYVYAFPAEDQWVNIHSVEIAAGTETLHSGSAIRENTQAKLHPDGDRMYGADRGLSPSDIERYDVTSGTASYAYDSPYHGVYGMCGNLWISEDGERIFTACGNTFSATDVKETDMRYTGALDANRVGHLDHSMETGYSIFTTSLDDDYWYSAAFDAAAIANADLNTVVTYPIPSLGEDYEVNALFTFFSADGQRAVLLMEAVGTSVESFFIEISTDAITAP